MYVGVRAGGGIGDELEDPAGDPYELYRILFDITFFFFVIVILLAIIQGTWSFFLNMWLYLQNRVVWLLLMMHQETVAPSFRFDHWCLWWAKRPTGAGEGGHGGESPVICCGSSRFLWMLEYRVTSCFDVSTDVGCRRVHLEQFRTLISCPLIPSSSPLIINISWFLNTWQTSLTGWRAGMAPYPTF